MLSTTACRPFMWSYDHSHVLLKCSSVGALLEGRSALHIQPDGSLKSPAPQDQAIKDEIVRLAIEVMVRHIALRGQLIADLCLRGQPTLCYAVTHL
jgi:hypothetical protein